MIRVVFAVALLFLVGSIVAVASGTYAAIPIMVLSGIGVGASARALTL